MSEYCSYRVENGITIIRFTKMPDFVAIGAIMEELATHYPNNLRLWDARDIVIQQSQEELRQIASQAAATFSKHRRAAFVANDDLTFGVLRIFEVYSNQESSDSQVRVFRSMEQATDWLLNEKANL